MPISRTVSGLKYEIPLDMMNEVDTGGYFTSAYGIDSETKHEGAASLAFAYGGQTTGYPTYAWVKAGAPNIATGDRFHIWHKSDDDNHEWKAQVRCLGASGCLVGGEPYYVKDIITSTDTIEDWTLKKADVPTVATGPGNRTLYVSRVMRTHADGSMYDWIDRCVISTSRYLTVNGLVPGQKVEVYRSSDNVKATEGTCAEGQTQVVLDIDTADYPLYLYLKVYASDGVTLVEVTADYIMCGGDTWAWNAPLGTMGIRSDDYTIYRTGSSGTPTSTVVTTTLRTETGDPYPGKTIYFMASKGSVSPSSDTTDANGEAETTLTCSVHGIAVVRAYWEGDASVPAAVAYATHHVMYDLEVADEDKKFQFFIEGIEYSYSKGHYALSSEGTPQEFSVEIPEWVSTITRRGLVSIYRKGVKEFGGVLTVIDRTLADPPSVILSGVDGNVLLEMKVVTVSDYSAEDINAILDDLLTTYWCGVTLGTVGAYPNTITQTFTDESLASSISRLCDIIGWEYRLQTDYSLDVKASFGSIKSSITFTQGENLFVNKYRIDDREVCNSLRMRGNETLVSTAFDGDSIMTEDLGLLEDVAFQKSIADQATLDLAALAELAHRAGLNVQIQAQVMDSYDAGEWGLDDWVTLTVSEHSLSDVFKVVKIERDMTDPNVAVVDFTNKLAHDWGDVWVALRRELKDLGAKTTI